MAAETGNLKRSAGAQVDGGRDGGLPGDEAAPSAAPPPPATAPPANAAGDAPAAENQPPGRCF